MKILQAIIVGIIVIVIVAFFFIISTGLIYFVWNALAAYFGFKKVTFLIAICINIALWIISGIFKQTSKSK